VTSRAQAEPWLSARALGSGVFQFLVTLKDARADDGEGVVVGILGSYHWPSVGYILHTGIEIPFESFITRGSMLTVSYADHTGKGYATEALRAWIPAFFAHMPPANPEEATGFDYIEAKTDVENFGSQKVLEKSGFMLCEVLENEFEHATLGWRSTKVFRLARPGGKTLEEMGLVAREDGDGDERGFVPPIQ